MSNVVQLIDRRVPRLTAEPSKGPATIYLFLGVRYERVPESVTAPRPAIQGAKPGRRRRKRRAS